MKYVALFRGINVGGKNIAPMAELKKMLAELGFEGVSTYIQSGNAVFASEDGPEVIAERIGAAFSARFGFESKVILRNKAEWEAILARLPFSPEEIAAAEAAAPEVEHLYLYLLEEAAPGQALGALQAAYAGPDRLVGLGREIYFLCHQSVRDSKLAASLAKLNLPMTCRNWKTLNKIAEILRK